MQDNVTDPFDPAACSGSRRHSLHDVLWVPVPSDDRGEATRLGTGVLSRLIVLLLAVMTVVTTGASRPLLAGAQATRSFVWDRVDVVVALQADSTLHITEHDRALFSGGPFRTGFRDIPLTRVE